MNTTEACQAANRRSERHAEICDAIERQEHRLVAAAIGSAEWQESLTQIVKHWAELERL